MQMKQKAVIFDIDCTLSQIGEREMLDFEKVHLDTPILGSWRILEYFASKGYKILFVTARVDVCRDVTTSWLNRVLLDLGILLSSGSELHMRTEEEHILRVQDAQSKSRIMKELIVEYDIEAVFDDSERCCKMYSRKGLTVYRIYN